MRRVLIVPTLLCGLAFVAGAQQGSVTGKLSCAKPSVNAVEPAQDASGHMLMLQKASCTWTTSPNVAGHTLGATTDVAIGEVRSGSGSQHGYSTSVMDNGDTTVVRFEGTMQMKQDGSGTSAGKWRYVRGTGVFKGIQGSGTYKGTAASDGSGSADVSGHYTLGGARKGKTKSE